MPVPTTTPAPAAPLTFAAVTSANGKRHEGFTSLFSTDAEAAASIVADPKASAFGRDLAANLAKWGNLSEARRFWLHRVATPRPAAPTVEVDASAIEAIFAKASAKLKFPKFILNRGSVTLKVAKAGPRSKHHGSITVAAPEFGEGWFGVIKDGAFHPARGATPEVVQLVKDFAADPAKVAGEHGHASGNCCFCRRELTTTESLAAGFGPVCAENFGLPWGNKIAAA